MDLVPRVPLDHPATYQDLVASPDAVVAEIVDGELHASPRPSLKHARGAMRLASALAPAFDEGEGGRGGWIFLFEPELHLRDDVLVPDLAGWRVERMPSVDAAYATLAPDWVCELLSPSTEQLDRRHKLAIYAREGVTYAWLINPAAQTLEACHLADGHWVLDHVYGDEDMVRASPFEAIALEPSRLWGRGSPPAGTALGPNPVTE